MATTAATFGGCLVAGWLVLHVVIDALFPPDCPDGCDTDLRALVASLIGIPVIVGASALAWSVVLDRLEPRAGAGIGFDPTAVLFGFTFVIGMVAATWAEGAAWVAFVSLGGVITAGALAAATVRLRRRAGPQR